MQSYKVLFVLLGVCVGLSIQEDLTVSVYYESLCPDSINFIVKQLYPTYTKLGSLFSVDLVPYGKAIQNQENGRWKFQCQHGPNECYGNKVQACALSQSDVEFSKKMAFVNCCMDSSNPSKAGEQCAGTVGITWEPIRACANSVAGDNLLAALGDRTHSRNPQITFVPTVIFNDVYNDKSQWEALKNLRQVVCNLKGNPSECS